MRIVRGMGRGGGCCGAGGVTSHVPREEAFAANNVICAREARVARLQTASTGPVWVSVLFLFFVVHTGCKTPYFRCFFQGVC